MGEAGRCRVVGRTWLGSVPQVNTEGAINVGHPLSVFRYNIKR